MGAKGCPWRQRRGLEEIALNGVWSVFRIRGLVGRWVVRICCHRDTEMSVLGRILQALTVYWQIIWSPVIDTTV